MYRRELVETRNRHVNRLHADLEQLHCGYHHNIPTRLTTPTALTKASYLLRGDNNTRAGVAKRRIRHIRHIRELNRQIDDLATQITAMVRASGTTLTNIYGVGALVAAEILAGVGDPTRYTTKAKFAMANGTAPLEASSGRVVRHRLNHGGNRQLNKAIHTIAITQIARPNTEGRTYYERKLACGKTKREAIRSLKRRVSDRIWTHLQQHNPTHNLNIGARLDCHDQRSQPHDQPEHGARRCSDHVPIVPDVQRPRTYGGLHGMGPNSRPEGAPGAHHR